MQWQDGKYYRRLKLGSENIWINVIKENKVELEEVEDRNRKLKN